MYLKLRGGYHVQKLGTVARVWTGYWVRDLRGHRSDERRLDALILPWKECRDSVWRPDISKSGVGRRIKYA